MIGLNNGPTIRGFNLDVLREKKDEPTASPVERKEVSMFGRTVKVKLSDEVEISVWVWCTQQTLEVDLKKRAIEIVKSSLDELVPNVKAETRQ